LWASTARVTKKILLAAFDLCVSEGPSIDRSIVQFIGIKSRSRTRVNVVAYITWCYAPCTSTSRIGPVGADIRSTNAVPPVATNHWPPSTLTSGQQDRRHLLPLGEASISAQQNLTHYRQNQSHNQNRKCNYPGSTELLFKILAWDPIMEVTPFGFSLLTFSRRRKIIIPAHSSTDLVEWVLLPTKPLSVSELCKRGKRAKPFDTGTYGY
jgi:hypothetical protein